MTSDLQLLRSTKALIKRHSVSIVVNPATFWDPATIQTWPLLTNLPPDPWPLFEPRPLFKPGLYTDKYGSYLASLATVYVCIEAGLK